jgi:sulfur relay protein TusB/DsrH
MPRDAALTIEDGVPGVREGSSAATAVKAALASGNVYALTPDLDERSIKRGRLVDGVQTIDYGGFVEHALLRSFEKRITEWRETMMEPPPTMAVTTGDLARLNGVSMQWR